MSPLTQMTRVAILAAVGLCLMKFEIPIFPSADFLKYDPGDIPVLIGAFALGPLTGIYVALLKNVLYLFTSGTPTAWIGAPMNFLAGASFAFCAGNIYFLKKTKIRAVISLVAGGLFSAVVMFFANLVVLPIFMRIFMPGMDGASMHLLLTVIVPFNLIKAAVNGVLVFVVYKRISPILKAAHWELPARPLRIGRLETPG